MILNLGYKFIFKQKIHEQNYSTFNVNIHYSRRMIWHSGYKLAAAVSNNASGLGLIGAGSMYPDVLKRTYSEM